MVQQLLPLFVRSGFQQFADVLPGSDEGFRIFTDSVSEFPCCELQLRRFRSGRCNQREHIRAITAIGAFDR